MMELLCVYIGIDVIIAQCNYFVLLRVFIIVRYFNANYSDSEMQRKTAACFCFLSRELRNITKFVR